MGAIWPQAVDMRDLFGTILPGFAGLDAGSVLTGAAWVVAYAA